MANDRDSGQEGDRAERIEVVVYEANLIELERLDLDRLPDVEGAARLLVSREELSVLEQQGFNVETVRRIPLGPLDPALVFTDETAGEWLTSRLDSVQREQEAD